MDRKEQLSKILQSTEFKNFQITQVAKQDEQQVQNSNIQYNQAFLLQSMQLQQQMKQQMTMINNANAVKSYSNQPVPQFSKEINCSKELIPSYFNNSSNNINNSYSIKDQTNKVAAANLVNSYNKVNIQANENQQQQQQGYINQSQRDLRSISREKEQNKKQPNSNSPKKEIYQQMQKIDQKDFQKQQFQQPNELLQNLQNYNEYCAPQQQFSNVYNQNKQSYLLVEQIQKSKAFEQNSNLNASCNLKEEFNNIQSTDRDQKTINGNNVNQLNDQPQQNPQIKESFKLEIERRYQKSEINQIYRFPKDSNCSTDSESSLVSLVNVEMYNLNEQNTPKPLQQLNIHTIKSANQSQQQSNQAAQIQQQYLNNMQQSDIMQTSSANHLKQQFNQSNQKQQNLQQISQQQLNIQQQYKSQQQFQQQQLQNQSQQRNMKVCLSQRNLNNQIKNNNYINTSTSFIAQGANNNPNINLTSSNNISNVPQNNAIIQDFGLIKQQQQQQQQHPPIAASSSSQSKLKVQQNQQIQQQINKQAQTIQNSNSNNNRNSSNTASKTLKKNDQTKSFSDLRASNQNSNLNSNNFIQPQFQQNFQSSSLGRVANTNNITNNNSNPVAINQQNQISVQQSQQQLLQQPSIEQKSTQIQQLLQILQTQNSQSNLSKPNSANQFDNQNKSINQSQQAASNNYYLTERWKKDSSQQIQKNNLANIQNCCNTLINNLTLSTKKQDSKLIDVQLENSQNNDQFLNVNQLLEKSGYQTFANVSGMPQGNINNSINAATFIASNNVSTKNVNQSQLMSNCNFKQNSDQSFAMNQKINHDNKKSKVELQQDSIPHFNLTMNAQQEQTLTSSSSKNQNYENRSRIQQDIELQNRIMKMRQNLDEKLRQSTSRSNEKRTTVPQQQKTTSNDIIQKLKTIIQQNDMMGNPSSMSSRNTQRKDKYDTSKSFETKKANNTNNLYSNVNVSVNNNSSQQIQNVKQFREQQSSLKSNNQNSNNCTSSKQLDRNSSAKQLTNKSQSKEKLQSNSKPQHLLTQNSQNNLLQQSNNKTTNNLPHTPQSQANKQISALLNQKQGSNNSSSKLNQSSSNKQNNSLSKVKQSQNITKSQQAVNSNQTNNTSNISSSNFNNGTTTVATTTTTASNTNSTINPQNNIFSINNNTIQKTPSQQQGLTQQVQNAIAGLKMNQNILKDQQTQSIINQVIQKQQEQIQQNKMNSYKSSGSLLKNYSNSNLQVQTSRNQPKTNIRDVRIKLQEQPANNNCQTDIYTGSNTNNVNNSSTNNNANNNQRGKIKNFSFIFNKNIH
ncbi:hypothetical protein ABPG72_017812 [Tetrahymena utriculariae]